MAENKVKVDHICSDCGKKNHNWFEVYYEESSKLKRAEKAYIAWCNSIKGYVIINNL